MYSNSVPAVISKNVGNALTNYKTWGGIIFNVKEYGAKGDGVADDTSHIQSAINAAKDAGGGIVYFPTGTFLYTSLIIDFSNVCLNGSGSHSKLVQNHATSNGITFYNSSGPKEYAQIRNLFFDSAVTKTAGAAIATLNYKYVIIDSCYFQNQFDTLGFGSYQYMFVQSCYFKDNKNADITLTFGDGCFVVNCMLQNSSITSGSIGFLLNHAGGTNLINCDVTNHDFGIRMVPGANQFVQWTFINNTAFDTCNYGLWADTSGGGAIYSIDSVNSWYSSNIERGIDLRGVDGFSSSNDRVILNHSDGVFISNASKNVQFSNCQICANGVDAAKGDNGIFVFDGTDNFSIRGCLITNNYAGTYSYQGTGILINAGTSDNLIITENNLIGNTTPISDTSSGSNRIIGRNLGYVTENKGTSTQSGNGSTTVFTIPHGLAKTPTFAAIFPTTAAGAIAYRVNTDGNNLYITYVTAPIAGTNNLIFNWSAEV